MNTILKHFIKISLMLVLLLQAGSVEAQSWITWNTATNATTFTGTYPGGTVTVSQGATGNDVLFNSPASNITNLNVATTAQAFKTTGPYNMPPSKSLIFTFSSPVIVSELNIADINKGASWDDTFTFSGISFTSVTGTNCNYTLTGATPTTTIGTINAEYARWATSTTAVSSFTINYPTTGGMTHAALFYSMKVVACAAGSAPVPSATTITNNCTSSSSVNLNSLVATTPTGASLQWFSDNTHTNAVTTPTAVTSSGTYYAFYYDATNNCYSPVSAAVTATLTACCPTASPTVN